jgi:hypothetical protein
VPKDGATLFHHFQAALKTQRSADICNVCPISELGNQYAYGILNFFKLIKLSAHIFF